MAEKHQNDENTSSSGGNNTASGNNDTAAPTSTGNNETDTAAIRPTDVPVSATANASTGNNSEAEANQEKSRSLGRESKAPEKDPLAAFLDPVKEALNLVAEFNLRPESLTQVASGITGPIMAGLKVTKDMVENVVKKVDPLEYAATKFRESVGGAMASVDNSRSAQLPSQSVGQPQQDRGQSFTLSA